MFQIPCIFMFWSIPIAVPNTTLNLGLLGEIAAITRGKWRSAPPSGQLLGIDLTSLSRWLMRIGCGTREALLLVLVHFPTGSRKRPALLLRADNRGVDQVPHTVQLLVALALLLSVWAVLTAPCTNALDVISPLGTWAISKRYPATDWLAWLLLWMTAGIIATFALLWLVALLWAK